MLASASAISKKLGVTANTVRHWVTTWQRTGQVDEKGGQGRKPTLGGEAAGQALAMLKDPDMGTASAVARTLQARGITKKVVHRSTVVRAARGAAGAKLVHDARPPLEELTPETKGKRLAFAQANLGRDWSRVMFTDRKKFLLASPGAKVHSRVWRVKGEPRRRAPKRNRPWAFNIYAGLTVHGCTAVHAVAGSDSHKGSFLTKQGKPARNITAAQYATVVRDTFIPEGRRLLVHSRRSKWVLQQDNDPTHKAAAGVLEESSDGAAGIVTLLPNWPPHSPDLSPIENMWAIVDRDVQSMGCSTRKEWEDAVRARIAAFPLDTIKRMYDGMDGRMQAVIAAGGDRINH